MILLSLFIVIFIVYSYLISRVLVRCFPQQLGKIKYRWPIGFFAILSLIQLVSFPLQYKHLSMSVVTVVYHFIFLVLTGLIIIELFITIRDQRKTIRRFDVSQLIEFGLIGGFFVFNFLICYLTNSFNDTNADQSFYITLVENNLNATQINMITPLSGIISPLESLYNFQGFYLFLTYLSSVFHIESILLMGWFVPSLLWLTASLSFLNVIHCFKLSHKWWLTAGTFLTLWAFVDLFDYFVRYNCYGNNIRVFVFIYLMIFYFEYFKRSRVKTLILCGLLWLSAISLQSTSLFLGIFLMVAYGLYDLFYSKKGILVPLIFSALPLMLYATLFLGYRGSWTPGYLLFGMVFCLVGFSAFKRTREFLNQLLYNNGTRCVVILGVIAITLLSIWMTPRLNENISVSPSQFIKYLIEKYELKIDYFYQGGNYPMIFLIAVRRIILWLNLYLLLKFKQLNAKLKFIVGTQVIMLLVFYNPLIVGLISTAFTGIVYTRLGDIVLSIFAVTGFILYGIKDKYIKYLVYLLMGISVLFLGTKTRAYLKEPYNQIENRTTYNYLYRMDQSLIDIALALENYIDENITDERPKVFTTLHHLNYFNSLYEMIYTVEHNRRLDNQSYRERYADIYNIRDGIKLSYEVGEDLKEQFIPLINKYEIDFVITSTDIDGWLKQTLQSIGYCIFENADYYIYRIYKSR